MKKLKIACIGAGCSGTNHMIWFEERMPGSVVAFCDLNRDIFDRTMDGYFGKGDNIAGDFKQKINGLTEEFRNLPFYTNVDKMLVNEDINTVLICTSCDAHAQMVEKCVKENMHILLEKPIAITEEDIEKVWQSLKNYPKVATVNFTMRGAPVSLAAKQHIQNGTIGDIISVQYTNNVHYGDVYFRGWMRTRKRVGNLWLQKATHDFDIINSIIGLKPVSAAAFGSRLVYGGNMPNDLTCDNCDKKLSCPMSIYRLHFEAAKPLYPIHLRKCVYAKEIDIDDNQVSIFQYEGGVNVSYSQSFNAPQQGGQRGGCFVGTEGIMQLRYYNEFVETPQKMIIVGNSAIDIIRYRQKPGSRIHEVYDWAGHSHFDGTEYGLEAKVELLTGQDTKIKNSIEEGYISAKMCLAAQKSIEAKKIIALDLVI
ncbi:MAG: Gfo/Idh/MocA family oxidoreductase [Victivallaceae bacterium]|nr:Gfo/Idh/MocA family oxidoreductase [Victivallaceae bacterium]